MRIRWCDCGNPKPSGKVEECGRCAFLDSGGRVQTLFGKVFDRQAHVIAALRTVDGMSLEDLCVAVGMDASVKNGRRSMLRTVQRLMKSGRLSRYWDESEFDGKCFGMSCIRRAGFWRYSLSQGMRRAERQSA